MGARSEASHSVHTVAVVHEIVEGDKAAGSYNKLMITDFCMSLSRLPQDKINNTARFFLMKNRYGMDGMTYYASMDTSMGIIEMDENPTELPEGVLNNNNRFGNEVTKGDKKQLAQLSDEFFVNKS